MALPPIPINLVSLLTRDALSLFAGVANLPWGIYLGPVPVVLADNVVSFEYSQQFQISNYPIEGGQFESFNKVYRPFDVAFRFTAGGDLVNRQKFLDSIAAFIGDTNEYSVVTADAVYLSVNLVGYHYHQTAGSGVGLIQVDVMAQQIKNAVSATLTSIISSPREPGSASLINGGTVQSIPAIGSQLSQLPSILGFG